MITTQNNQQFTAQDACPCESGKPFKQCCEPLLEGRNNADTASALMRSRFCAFVFQRWDYLSRTALNSDPNEEIQQYSADKIWCSLKILKTKKGSEKDTSGEVEFVAFYQGQQESAPKTLRQHHEHSHFQKIDGLWYFTQGMAMDDIKPDRNGNCPCGSGKKYKKCCAQ